MLGVYENEQIELKFIGSSHEGQSSNIEEKIDFSKTSDDPFERSQLLIESYGMFLNKMGVSIIDYYFSVMRILEANNLLDSFYKFVKEENIAGLYEAVEAFAIDENLLANNEGNEKSVILEMQNKLNELSFSSFENKISEDQGFRKYLYQLYLDDLQ